MAGVDVGGNRGARRSVDSEINMVPMIDLLMVTMSFLLLTAVWTHERRLDGTANVPGSDHAQPKVEDHARVHVEVPVDEGPLKLTLRREARVIDSATLPRSEVTNLSASIAHMRSAHGENDPVVVVHVDNAIPYRQMVAVMDAISKDRGSTVNLATK